MTAIARAPSPQASHSCDAFVGHVRRVYASDGFIPLHAPRFDGRERDYVLSAIDSTFVSSVGEFVDRFEAAFAERVGAAYAIATSTGTAALHTALRLAGVERGEEVVTQPLTFVATCNAIAYLGAEPVFIDVDRDTLGLSPAALRAFLERHAVRGTTGPVNRATGRRIAACVPMHTFGHPARVEEIAAICADFDIPLIEDAAEALGSVTPSGRHAGTVGAMGAFSFNGNKIITTGAGGMIVTDDKDLAARAKHLTTTAKVPSPWEFIHDEIGYNYRPPNLNAALGLAQLEQLDDFLAAKRALAREYEAFCETSGVAFVPEPPGCRSNYWLNAVILPDRVTRDRFLAGTNGAGVMTRPAWRLMTELEIYSGCYAEPLPNAEWLAERVVNVPSAPPSGPNPTPGHD